MANQKKSHLKGVTLDERALFRRAVDNERWTSSDENLVDPAIQSSSENDRVGGNPSIGRNVGQGIIQDNGDLFYRSGVQKNTLRNLKRGRFKTRVEIDLHGCTKKEAISYLNDSISQCNAQAIECLRIVTGKGRGSPNHRSVIRETTLAMLSREPRVLAFCTALPKDGGSGALYVLIAP